MKKNLISMVTMVYMVGCGSIKDMQQQAALEQQQDQEIATMPSTSTPELVVAGYVSPINVTVDSKNYDDSEDFYTTEMARLKKKVADEFGADYTFRFDAKVGLKDIKNNMSVFLVADNEGLSGETSVDSNGQFRFRFTNANNVDASEMYTLRAYKRLNMSVYNPATGDKLSWCYNMYAERKTLLEKSKSLVLREFKTKITEYACQQENDDGLEFPSIPSNDVVE